MSREEIGAILRDAGFVEQWVVRRRGKHVADIVNDKMYIMSCGVMVDVMLADITCVQYDREFDDLRVETKTTVHVFSLREESDADRD